MIKKIGFIFLIVFILYILAIFNLPNVATALGKAFGIEKFNEFVLSFKTAYDETVTDLPSKEEVKNTYENAYSGAVEFGDKFIDGLNITKSKIDGFRENLTGAKETIKDIKEGINDAKVYIENASGTMKEAKEILEDINGVNITSSGNIN